MTSSDPAALPSQQPALLDLRDLWRIVVSHWFLLLSVTALATGAGIAAAFLMTPVYRAQALLAPVIDDANSPGMSMISASPLSGFAALAGIGMNAASSRVTESIALLQAREFTEQFIRDNDLLPQLFPKKWSTSEKRWVVDDPKKIPTVADGYKLFSRKVRTITEDRRSGFITLSIEWKDPETAARWASLLIEGVNRRMRERTIEEAQRSLDFLNSELRKSNVVEVQQAIYRIIEVQIKNIMLANVRQQYSFRIIDPPVAPASNDYIKPKKLMLIALGFMFGLTAGLVLVFVRHAFK